jgi:CDP-diacylglycerol--glycerol-3-phosphate 3-phosphatidyltransferase
MVTRSDVTVPNVLTVLRILMAVSAIFLIGKADYSRLAASMLIIASFLDYFDGWYARKFKQVTKLGTHLDPFADKVLMAVISLGRAFAWTWFYYFVAVIMLREIIITVYRMIVRRRSGEYVQASKLGKIKTILQSVVGDSLLFYIYFYPGKIPDHYWLIFSVMTIVMFVTVDSGLRYILPRCSDGKKRSVLERVSKWIFGALAREA